MNAQLFVYTRTKNVDYQAIISPSEEFCPKSTRKLFLTQARGIINVEQYDDPLVEPRWLFSKKGNLLLWGIGVQNKELNEDVYKDFTGRPVRGFFGLVIDLSEQEALLPFDLAFFKKLYLSYIVPLWDVEFDSFKKSSIPVDLEMESFTCISKATSTIILNTDTEITSVLGNVNLSDVFSTALGLDSDTSVVSGFSSKAHAYAHEYNYLNAIVMGVNSPETKSHKKPMPATPPPIPISRPKKALRLGLILATIVFLIALMIILHKSCNREINKNQNQQELVSGVQKDSIQNKE